MICYATWECWVALTYITTARKLAEVKGFSYSHITITYFPFSWYFLKSHTITDLPSYITLCCVHLNETDIEVMLLKKKNSIFRFVYVLFQWKWTLLLRKPEIRVDTVWWPHKQSIKYTIAFCSNCKIRQVKVMTCYFNKG